MAVVREDSCQFCIYFYLFLTFWLIFMHYLCSRTIIRLSMATQEKRISYRAGITRSPSDFLCQDGDLAECINLTTDNEELKPMVPPAGWLTAATGESLPEILYIHRVNGTDIIIGVREVPGESDNDPTTYMLEYGINDGGVYIQQNFLMIAGDALVTESKPKNIVSIGLTLIVSYPEITAYFRWDPTEGTYKFIPSDFSGIGVNFLLNGPSQEDPGRPFAFNISGFVHHEPVVGPVTSLYYKLTTENEGEYESIKNVLIGAVSERIRKVAEQKRFAFPFWARYAIRLYDGTYTNISQPFLLFPTVNHNCDIFFSDVDGEPYHLYNRDWSDGQCLNYRPYSADLMCSLVLPQDIADWSDIIAGIDIFVSEQQMPFNLEGDWHFINPFDYDHQGNYAIYNSANGRYSQEYITESSWNDDTTEKLGFVTYFGLTHLSDADIMKNLLDKSVFYRIAQIDFSEFSYYSTARLLNDKMTETTLRTLTSQTRLEHDDYFSRNIMRADVMKTYNKRLHLAGVSRSFFEGFDKFTGAEYNTGSAAYRIAVTIKTDSGMRLVVKDVNTTAQIMNIWFYYPDPRATNVKIYKKSSTAGKGYLVFDIPLTEHEGLNGAYFFDHFPYPSESIPSGTTQVNLPTAVDDDEIINDRVFVSEVGNPFVFTARGEVEVGQGDIIGLATQTVALGQEEHGIHPLIVFTKRGTSIMRVNDEGYYTRPDELNREVCLNPSSITETDGAVFFVSKKGLMVIVGEKTDCVTERMNGIGFDYRILDGIKPADLAINTSPAYPWAGIITPCQGESSFMDFITGEKCRIAYDYIDSRLWLIRNDKQYAYIYNMSDGAVSKAILPSTGITIVNNYPDYLLQSGDNVFSLYGKAIEQTLVNRSTNPDLQRAFLLTRPMKLAGPLSVTSIRELVNVGMWKEKVGTGETASEVKTVIWVSDNLQDWYVVGSRFGAAAKYFRIGLFINMLPTERLSGTIITEQERRTDNKRV